AGIVKTQQMAVLGEELGDRDILLPGRHRLGRLSLRPGAGLGDSDLSSSGSFKQRFFLCQSRWVLYSHPWVSSKYSIPCVSGTLYPLQELVERVLGTSWQGRNVCPDTQLRSPWRIVRLPTPT